MIESLASGVPVAAYPVTGPLDIIQEGVNGSLNDDLGCAINNAMLINGLDCINSAQAYCWENVAEQFLDTLVYSETRELFDFDKTSSVS